MVETDASFDLRLAFLYLLNLLITKVISRLSIYRSNRSVCASLCATRAVFPSKVVYRGLRSGKKLLHAAIHFCMSYFAAARCCPPYQG